MKKNDTFILKIEDMGIGGEGIGKYEGMTFFVKDAVIGDEILAGVTTMAVPARVIISEAGFPNT